MNRRTRKTAIALLVKHGAVGGIIAGFVFAMVEMLSAVAMGNSVFAPWRAFASILLGAAVLDPAKVALGVAILVGLMAHFGLSIIFGAVYGLLMSMFRERRRQSYGTEASLGIIYGVILYLVNFQIFGRLIYPWFLEMPQIAQAIYHAFAFGLILALYYASAENAEPSTTLAAGP